MISYLKSRRAVITFYLCFATLFAVVFFLYNMDMSSVAYGLLLCSFIMLIWFTADYLNYKKRYNQLKQASGNIGQYLQSFPQPQDDMEKLYLEIISQLYEVVQKREQALSKSHNEQVDYYTMWLHQIKTPISAIKLALDSGSINSGLYRQELFKVERYVEMALQNAKLNGLSSDLVIKEYDLDAIIGSSLKKFAVLFSQSGLSIDYESVNQTVITDSKWLSFIIEQLISNAIKYTREGKVSIYWRGGLLIEDTGIGIKSEDLPRIFEKGYTGHNGRLDRRASGLGLHMSKRVCEQLSITMSITSQIGSGTRVRLLFPESLENPE